MAPKDGIACGAMVGMSAALLAGKGYTGIPSLLGDGERNHDVFTLGGVPDDGPLFQTLSLLPVGPSRH